TWQSEPVATPAAALPRCTPTSTRSCCSGASTHCNHSRRRCRRDDFGCAIIRSYLVAAEFYRVALLALGILAIVVLIHGLTVLTAAAIHTGNIRRPEWLDRSLRRYW